jgi:NADPH:quinone reductase-like Zn-dependent oxidoreductase
MRAVVLREFGGPEVLQVEELPDPEPAPGEVLVRVSAVCIGRLLDLAARAGKLPFAKIEFPHVLGAESAGRVEALGEGVDEPAVGTRVAVSPVVTCGTCRFCSAGDEHVCPDLELFGIHRDGAYAEYIAVPEANVRPIPDDVSDADAAAIALSGATGRHQLDEAGVGEGTWVLVQAASSAIGSVTAALAVHRGARVIGTTRQDWKLDRIRELGVAAALNHEEEGFVEEVLRLTGGEGADVVVDNIGNPELWKKSVQATRRGGTIVTSGAFMGGQCDLDVRSLYTFSQRIIGLRTHDRQSFQRVWEDVDKGVRAPVDRTFPLDEASAAHEYVEGSENVGRVLLDLG